MGTETLFAVTYQQFENWAVTSRPISEERGVCIDRNPPPRRVTTMPTFIFAYQQPAGYVTKTDDEITANENAAGDGCPCAL